MCWQKLYIKNLTLKLFFHIFDQFSVISVIVSLTLVLLGEEYEGCSISGSVSAIIAFLLSFPTSLGAINSYQQHLIYYPFEDTLLTKNRKRVTCRMVLSLFPISPVRLVSFKGISSKVSLGELISTLGQGDYRLHPPEMSNAATKMDMQTLYGVRARVLFSGLDVLCLMEVAQPDL
jgi:hypothetical protein